MSRRSRAGELPRHSQEIGDLAAALYYLLVVPLSCKVMQYAVQAHGEDAMNGQCPSGPPFPDVWIAIIEGILADKDNPPSADLAWLLETHKHRLAASEVQ